jgi:hypothetical protein
MSQRPTRSLGSAPGDRIARLAAPADKFSPRAHVSRAGRQRDLRRGERALKRQPRASRKIQDGGSKLRSPGQIRQSTLSCTAMTRTYDDSHCCSGTSRSRCDAASSTLKADVAAAIDRRRLVIQQWLSDNNQLRGYLYGLDDAGCGRSVPWHGSYELRVSAELIRLRRADIVGDVADDVPWRCSPTSARSSAEESSPASTM